MDLVSVAVLVWMVATVALAAMWLRSEKQLRSVREANKLELEAALEHAWQAVEKTKAKYSKITDKEAEVARLSSEIGKLADRINEIRSEYSEKRNLLGRLKEQVAVYDERLSFSELGIYEPHFDFDDSEAYKRQIKEVRDRQKAMVKAKTATRCPADWSVDGSLAKGQTMINRQMRLTMRAFNNECEAAIAKTRWNNAVAMEKRILNSAKQINSANTSMKLEIDDGYVALRLEELHLTHEYREQLKKEKDERIERARLEREEQKFRAEAQAALEEERKYQNLLQRARTEAGVDGARIAELETALSAAHEKAERAKSMAERTKSGYVYIISNVGSFGEDIVKIGLTRRLEPNERVKELGDASVPFAFDTHAIIYSEDAPSLEAALHKEFDDRRINIANLRKEFFRVNIEEVEDAVSRLAPDSSFFRDREAKEWHETLARRKQLLESMSSQEDDLPIEI